MENKLLLNQLIQKHKKSVLINIIKCDTYHKCMKYNLAKHYNLTKHS